MSVRAVEFPGQGHTPSPAPALVEPVTARAAITSVAAALPRRTIANEEIAAQLGVSPDWIVARTGVRERRIAGADESLAELATAAGARALERAGVEAGEVDLVLVATVAGDDLLPNAAPLVAKRLGAVRAGAFDLGAACTGFLSALAVAAAQVEAGRAACALVIGADLLSRLTDPGDRATAALFADGAGAAVVGPARSGGRIGPVQLRADGAGAAAIRASHGDRLIRMQGHDTFREAVKRLSGATMEAVAGEDLSLDEIDLFVYHQANARILTAVAERLGVDRARVFDSIERHGNTSSATIPIALAHAEEEGRLAPGSRVLLAAFGSGFTWGAGVVEWA